MAFPKVPLLIYQPFAAVFVVEKRGVEPAPVQEDRFDASRPENIFRRDEIVLQVLEVADPRADYGVDEPEFAVA